MKSSSATSSSAGRRRRLLQPRTPPPADVPFFELSRLMVVAVQGSKGQLVCKGQTKPNGPWEANWTPVETTHSFGPMAAGITGDGRVAVVAQPASGADVLYIDETANAVGTGVWNAPVDIGKPPGVSLFTQFTMATDGGGRIEVFGLDNSGAIWWKYQNPGTIVQKTIQVTPPGTKTPITITVNVTQPPATPWSDWHQLPGGLATLRAVRGADGRIILFGINQQGHLYRDEQKVAPALAPSDWTGFVQIDDAATGIFSALATALDKTGAVNLFAVNQGGQVLHTRQDPPCSSTWAAWSTPGFILAGVQALAASIDGDGDIVLVATDRTKTHNVNQQWEAGTQRWTGWIPFNYTGWPVQTALDYNADGRLSLFSHWLVQNVPPYGGLWCISQMKLDSSEFEFEWTQLANGDIQQYAVVRDLTPPV